MIIPVGSVWVYDPSARTSRGPHAWPTDDEGAEESPVGSVEQGEVVTVLVSSPRASYVKIVSSSGVVGWILADFFNSKKNSKMTRLA